MKTYSHYEGCPHQLQKKYKDNDWFNGVLGYFFIRYYPIETRVLDAMRYVELAPANASTFSYEFGSILRDIGSTFSSILDKIVRNTREKPKIEFNISDYLKFLIREVDDIELLGAQLRCPYSKNMVFPFNQIKHKDSLWKDKLLWWQPYNNLKHSEIDNLPDGSLSNIVYGMASLAILYDLVSPYGLTSKLFLKIGYFKPMERVTSFLFPSYFRISIPMKQPKKQVNNRTNAQNN